MWNIFRFVRKRARVSHEMTNKKSNDGLTFKNEILNINNLEQKENIREIRITTKLT